MIINKTTKCYQTRSDAPNYNYMADIEPGEWVFADENTAEGQALIAKIVQYAPYFDFVLNAVGVLVDIIPIEPPAEVLAEALADAKTAKLAELSTACNLAITSGCEVELSTTSGHISLTAEDQINLTAANGAIEQGAVAYPYHLDGQLCAIFSAEDIRKLAAAASAHKLYHTTYYNHLAAWVRRCVLVEEVQSISYGSALPEDLAANMAMILGGVTSAETV